ncbi:hypothetical protein EIP91_006541 [Steccherinum ochraceum]|uniref:Uncharacterized protein n=1 Tax=Steccherinum ochraceum TaxID=92696 RepID=A0A4R0RBF0_9APHY|nr:hypothetical protein EIP91_006541 [Steccherinum ochraceum]
MPLRLSEAAIISTTVQGAMYGFSVLMFFLTGWILLRNKRTMRMNRGVIQSGVALLLLSTATFAVNIVRLREGMLYKGPQMPGGMDGYFADVSQPTWVIKSVLYNIQTLLLDGLVIYPTGLLAYRIWSVSRATTDHVFAGHLNVILRVVIESGALYSVAVVVGLVCFVTNSPGVYVVLDLICPIINIVFNMIIMRIGIATESQHPSSKPTTARLTTGLEVQSCPDKSKLSSRGDAQSSVLSLGIQSDAKMYRSDQEDASFVDADYPIPQVVSGGSSEGMMYGFSVLMFILTAWLLLRNRRRRRTNRGVMLAGVALFLLSTAIFAVNITRLRQGLLYNGPFLPGGIEQYFGDVSQSTFVIKSTLYNVQTLVLDAVVRWYIIVVPIMGWLGLLACTVGNNVTLALPAPTSGDVFNNRYGGWISAVYSTTLATNLTATGLLAYRIWSVNRKTANYASSDRLGIMLRVVIESGALYSIAIVAALICFVTGSPGVYVALDLLCPLLNIVYNMIIVRVGLATDSQFSPPGTTGPTSALDFGHGVSDDRTRRNTFRNTRDVGKNRSLAVELTHYLEMDGDQEASSVADRDSKTPQELAVTATSEDTMVPRTNPPTPTSIDPFIPLKLSKADGVDR